MAVAGPVLLTARSALGVTAVVVTLPELLLGTGSAVSLLAVAVFVTCVWSGVFAARWTTKVQPCDSPAASTRIEQLMVWPRPQLVGGRPESKPVKETKLSSAGSSSSTSRRSSDLAPALWTATW